MAGGRLDETVPADAALRRCIVWRRQPGHGPRLRGGALAGPFGGLRPERPAGPCVHHRHVREFDVPIRRSPYRRRQRRRRVEHSAGLRASRHPARQCPARDGPSWFHASPHPVRSPRVVGPDEVPRGRRSGRREFHQVLTIQERRRRPRGRLLDGVRLRPVRPFRPWPT